MKEIIENELKMVGIRFTGLATVLQSAILAAMKAYNDTEILDLKNRIKELIAEI